ncbi:MAG: PDZ domain-containing protein, partial [Planctomycetota bacterium]
QSATIASGSYDPDSGALNIVVEGEDTWDLTATLKNGSIEGSATGRGQGITLALSGSRSMSMAEAEKSGKGGKGKARETVEIAWDGFEERAVQIPVSPGDFGIMGVNEKNALIYARMPETFGGQASIKIFALDDEKREEKNVASGTGLFTISADGKKMLIVRDRSGSIQKAGAGGTGKPVPTAGMMARLDPREEWRQVFTDAWRIERDYFYDPNMHGVNWDDVRRRYAAMLDDCVTREDVGFVIREMIAELNVGHAYYGPGPEENEQPRRPVGMLGADYERVDGAYRIRRIIEGAPWDSDARGPLSQPGVDVAEGDYLLAVNGVPVDATRSPWAAFEGLAGRPIHITVSEKPTLDDEARDILVEPLRSESDLRYRAWIERNRSYVAEQSDGKLGYIYVPNTGINGQNDLYRQYLGQLQKKGLIIDERWNGGGQIPTRFIELLNRPITNYWARRDGRDWPWPPDAHQGPKCMLINGEAGSGGDAFPAYFRQAGLGKLIGTRTWGGLVGLSGNPRMIDGSIVTAPTFAFYESDGTWGIEGHGVEPDIEVLDDPAKMVGGKDPQLDAAITHMLDEVKKNGYHPPKRPSYPDRSGMGVTKADR